MSLTVGIGDPGAFITAPLTCYGQDRPSAGPSRQGLKQLLSVRDRDISIFTVARDDLLLGRIMLHAPWSGPNSSGIASFAHFDCADDAEAAQALLEVATGWGRARGLNRLVGHVAPAGLPDLGIPTQGGASHLALLLAENGFAPAGDLETFCIDPKLAHPPEIGPRQQAVLDDPDFSFAPQSAALRQPRLAEAEAVLNAAIGQTAPFVPPFQIDRQSQTDPLLCAVLHHRGHPVACCIGLPNPQSVRPGTGLRRIAPLLDRLPGFRPSGPRDLVVLCAVMPEFQGLAIAPLLWRRVMLALRAAGYDRALTHCTADLDGFDTAQPGVTAQSRLQLFDKPL